MSDKDALHATLVAHFAAGSWRGALLRGSSGAGKSELALTLIGRGWRLVADDRVVIWSSGGRLWGRAPEVLRHLLEVRGVGVLPFTALPLSQIALVIECVTSTETVERIPEPDTTALYGLHLPLHRLDALSSAAADKVAAICDALRL